MNNNLKTFFYTILHNLEHDGNLSRSDELLDQLNTIIGFLEQINSFLGYELNDPPEGLGDRGLEMLHIHKHLQGLVSYIKQTGQSVDNVAASLRYAAGRCGRIDETFSLLQSELLELDSFIGNTQHLTQ
jgi:hypothetical protein